VDLGKFDSVAGRVSFAPTGRLVLQMSMARLHEARTEFLQHTDAPITKMTASAIYHRPILPGGIWATTLAFGTSHGHDRLAVDDATTMAVLVESRLTLADRHTAFGRAELVQMPAHHLHAVEFATSVFPVGKVQVGYVRQFKATKTIVPGIGATAAFTVVPAALAPRYSGRIAPGIGVFLSLQPARHEM
jgi:hypothetical protein